ncbi:hypothetical protein HW132_28890 [Brasilonema sp. CT11]|nr:hypothetical protein [Brasilonema sp. CT11]
MFANFQDSTSASPEYREFMEEYDKMRTYSAQVSHIIVLIKTLDKESPQLIPLYIQAVEAHLCAINACRRMVTIYEQIFEKYWNNFHA